MVGRRPGPPAQKQWFVDGGWWLVVPGNREEKVGLAVGARTKVPAENQNQRLRRWPEGQLYQKSGFFSSLLKPLLNRGASQTQRAEGPLYPLARKDIATLKML